MAWAGDSTALKSKDPGSLSFSVDYDRQQGPSGIRIPGNTPHEYRVCHNLLNVPLLTTRFKVQAMCPGPLRTEKMVGMLP